MSSGWGKRGGTKKTGRVPSSSGLEKGEGEGCATRTHARTQHGLPPHGFSHLKTKYGLGIWNARCPREKMRKADRTALFSSSPKRMLTDDARFHHRIGSRSQMSRSSNYRAVLGTSWRNLRDR